MLRDTLRKMPDAALLRAMFLTTAVLIGLAVMRAAEPPALNPFQPAPVEREDAVPGRIELSDGTVHSGMIYLTRDKRLQIYDAQLQRQREIPLRAVKKIECSVKREWNEREWKFKETTSDEKYYTGRSYPAREYVHTITLKDGRTITGPLAAILYVQPPEYHPVRPEERKTPVEPEHFLLNKRAKGEMGASLKSLVYVKRVVLGDDEEEAKKPKGRKTPAPSDEQ